MSDIITYAELDRCGTCRFFLRTEGRRCIWCLRELADLFATLSHNLTIGAALCRAFDDGRDEAEMHRLYHEHGYRLEWCWTPGCGKAAP